MARFRPQNMTDRDLELFNDSLERCTAGPGFIDRFYELFLASSDEVKQKFARTDFKRLKRMLRESFYLMLMASSGEPNAQGHLERRAVTHSRAELDITPPLYDLWLRCLLQTVAEFDPDFNPQVQRAWQVMMMAGIDFMIERY